MKIYGFLVMLLFVIVSFSSHASVNQIANIRNAAINAYNAKDIDTLMSFWHSKGKILGPETIDGYREINAHYKASFADPHFNFIAMKSEGIDGIGDLFYDSGTMSILDDKGMKLMTGCYVLLYVKSGDSFKTWREWFYPSCLNTKHHE
jgi:ketosteroid isomerase-like protein